jgi:hypothetical protein
MGELINDLLMLVGILPMPRPEKTSNLRGIKIDDETFFSEGKLYNKIEKLKELSGQYVQVSDIHHGALAGNLRYLPHGFNDIYFLDDCSTPKARGTKMLHVHDLMYVFP